MEHQQVVTAVIQIKVRFLISIMVTKHQLKTIDKLKKIVKIHEMVPEIVQDPMNRDEDAAMMDHPEIIEEINANAAIHDPVAIDRMIIIAAENGRKKKEIVIEIETEDHIQERNVVIHQDQHDPDVMIVHIIPENWWITSLMQQIYETYLVEQILCFKQKL